jgi:hypothetical protein
MIGLRLRRRLRHFLLAVNQVMRYLSHLIQHYEVHCHSLLPHAETEIAFCRDGILSPGLVRRERVKERRTSPENNIEDLFFSRPALVGG